MRYNIDPLSLTGFIQCLSLPEQGDQMATPIAVQFRGDLSSLKAVRKVVTEAITALAYQEKHFHGKGVTQASIDYENGVSFFAPSATPVVAVLQQRALHLFVGSQVVFRQVMNHAALLAEVNKAIIEAES